MLYWCLMSQLFKASLILTIFFGINKLVALLRQVIIARQFGFSPEIDAFNVANNLPDLLFSLISGGALAMAFIPILTEYFDKKGEHESWRVFSVVANLVFLSTAVLSILVALLSDNLIRSQFGIAPGFPLEQQQLASHLMRLNLVATLIFSLSGLVMASLQAKKHFLLPAIAPILYNLGQIFGAVFLVPYFGVYGLVYGVILGSLLHLLIQVPGLIKYKFRWSPTLNINNPGVKRTLFLMGPRILTVLCIQIMFLTRDNLASRLQEGSVTALTYAYFIMQVPETLIGTAIATALLPTLSELATNHKQEQFALLMRKSIDVIFALTIISTVFLILSLDFFLEPLFGFPDHSSTILIWTTRAYLIGLLSQCLLEVTTRAFYAHQNAIIPLAATILRTVVFIFLSIFIVGYLGAAGLALADTLAITLEVIILTVLLKKSIPSFSVLSHTFLRALAGVVVSVGIFYLFLNIPIFSQSPLVIFPFIISFLVSLLFVQRELKLMLRL